MLSKTVDCTRLAPQTAQAPEADNNGGAGTVQGDPHLSLLAEGMQRKPLKPVNFVHPHAHYPQFLEKGEIPTCPLHIKHVRQVSHLLFIQTQRLVNSGVLQSWTLRRRPGTLDGRHYTLMQQGNFLLWGFSGATK